MLLWRVISNSTFVIRSLSPFFFVIFTAHSFFFDPLLDSLDTSEIHSENDAFGSTSGGVLLKKV